MSRSHRSVVIDLINYFHPDQLQVDLEIHFSHQHSWTSAGKTVITKVIPDSEDGNAPIERFFVKLSWQEYIENRLTDLRDRVEEERIQYADINGQKFRWLEDDLTVRDWLGIWTKVKKGILELTDPENNPSRSSCYGVKTNCLQGIH